MHTKWALPLPSIHGRDHTPTPTVSLNVYTNKVAGAVLRYGRVILVGQIMGGMVVTNAAEKIPAKVSRL